MDKKRYNGDKRSVINLKDKHHKIALNDIRTRMNKEQIRANDLAQMKGSSSWLNSLPLKSEGNVLNKREFHDALSLRYRWQMKYLPSSCTCGKKFYIDHAMSRLKGGFIHQRHDEMRDFLAQATEVCNDVMIEPKLLETTGEEFHRSASTHDEARLDFSARGFWQRGERAFFDVRVFNPFAPTHMNQDLDKAFAANEREKKIRYNLRVVDIEHGSFTPLIFTPYGGYSRETDACISKLASKIAEKRFINNSIVTLWLRSKISFLLLRSAILLEDLEQLETSFLTQLISKYRMNQLQRWST